MAPVVAATLSSLSSASSASAVSGGPAFAPAPPPLVWPAALPAPTTALIGRREDIRAAAALLQDGGVRLLTLTGPPGSGKTRLGIEVAARLAPAFTDGLAYVPLAGIGATDLVPGAIAHALGVPDAPGRSTAERVAEYLAPRHLLLALDNFEHVLEAAPLVGELLRACSSLRVLATSRALLRVSGEHAFPVQPLSHTLPHAGAPGAVHHDAGTDGTGRDLGGSADAEPPDAIRLFVVRAQAVHPSFTLTAGNRPAVAELCRRLDGLPLAIELAAARVRVLPPDQLLHRLDHSFAVLAEGPRDAPLRHRALDRAIAWSYDLLGSDGQSLFCRLSVFRGGFTLPAAEAVCAGGADGAGGAGGADGADLPGTDVLVGLSALVEQSLVTEEASLELDAGGEPRFHLLETLREFGAARLAASGEAHRLRDRHLAYCTALAERARPLLRGPDALGWLARLDAEHDNFQHTLQYALDQGDAAAGLRLAAALGAYWVARDVYAQGLRWLDALLALPAPGEGTQRTSHAYTRASALLDASALTYHLDRYQESVSLAEQALALVDAGTAPAVASRAHVRLAQAFGMRLRDYAAARAHGTAAIELGERAHDPTVLVEALGIAGGVEHEAGDFSAARERLTRSIAVARQAGLLPGTGSSLMLGSIAYREGDYADARPLVEEALAISCALGSRYSEANALELLCEIMRELGDLAAACGYAARALRLRLTLGARMSAVLLRIASIARRQGDWAGFVRVHAAGEALRPAGEQYTVFGRRQRDQIMAQAAAALGADTVAQLQAEGAALSLHDAVRAAFAIVERPAGATCNGASASGGAVSLRPPPGAQQRLSPREQEVARQLAQGLTNREVAAALSITEHTVARHVEHILAKLGMRSRAEVAAWVGSWAGSQVGS